MGFSIQCKNEVQFIFSEDSANVFPASALENQDLQLAPFSKLGRSISIEYSSNPKPQFLGFFLIIHAISVV